MKKTIIKGIFLSILATTFIGCTENDNDKNVYNGDSFVSFGTSTSASALESSTNAISVKAYASIPNLTEDVTVDFTISGTDASNYMVVDNKTSFSFGQNKYEDTLMILPVDNFDEDGEKILTITLTSVSNGASVGLPGPDGLSSSFTITLTDDDCAFTLAELGTATWAGMDTVPGSQAGPNESQITTSFDGTNLLIEGIAYGWLTDVDFWDEVVVQSNPVIAEVDPITGAINIALQDLATCTWNGDVQAPYSIQATGQYVSCTETMTIDYDLYQNGAVLRSFSETITIQ